MSNQVNGNDDEKRIAEALSQTQVKPAVLTTSNRPTMVQMRELFGDVIPTSVLEMLDSISLETPKEDVDKMLMATSRLFKDSRIIRALDVAKGVYELQIAKPFSEAFDTVAQGQITSFWASIFIAVFNDIDNQEKEKNDGTE